MNIKIVDFIFFTLLFFTIFIYFSFYSLNVDSTWILHSAKMMTEGSTLYVDMIDVNPPLIFVYSTFAVFISDFFSLSITNSYIFLVLTLISISSILSSKIIKNIEFSIENANKYFIYAIIFILTISVSYNFGQREHLFLIFIFPYLLFMIYKNYNENIHFLTKILIGSFAALGFNLKPHFFLIFIMIELIYIIDKKTILTFFRMESLIITVSGFFYIFIVYCFFPEYISFMIPFAIETYTDLFNKPYNVLLINYEFIFFILTFLFFIFFTKNRFTYSNKIILVSIFSSLIIYLLQQKGWSYHRAPFFIISLLFLMHLGIYSFNKKSIYLIILTPFIFMISYYNVISVYHYNSLKSILNKLPAKSTISIVSTDIAQGQPLLQKEQAWASRFPSNFMIPSIIKNKNLSVKKYTFDAIYDDLKKYKPNYIIFPSKKDRFDYYNFYISEDIRLKDFYEKYYKIDFENNYLILSKQKEF